MSISHQGRVHPGQVGSGRTSSLSRDRNDIRCTSNNDTRILYLGLVVQEEKRSMNMNDRSTLLLSVHLPNCVTVPDLGAVSIGGHGIPAFWDFALEA